MDVRNFIGKSVVIKINQPLGSKHPYQNITYLTNFGYIPATISGLGKNVYAYVLGIFEPIEVFEGTCIAIIHHSYNNNDTLVVAPYGKNYSNAQINALTEFQEDFFEIIR